MYVYICRQCIYAYVHMIILMFHIHVHGAANVSYWGGWVMLDNLGAACFQTKAVSKLGILIVVRMGLDFNQVLI